MFRFAHPEYLSLYGWLLCLLPLAFVFYWLWRRRNIKKLGRPELVNELMPGRTNVKHIFKFIFLLLGAACILIGLANPEIGSKLEKVKREGIDVVVALDISRSMNTEDVKPSRMERAKQFTSRLIDNMESDRVALIVFAGHAYVQMPLTFDHSAAKIFLNTVSTDLAGTQGTALGEAISEGQAGFKDNSKTSKVIILLSDGEDHEGNAIEEAENAAKDGTRIYTIGVGTEAGGPIPLFQNGAMTGFMKDQGGQTVTSQLNDSMLQQIASSGGGKYFRLTESNQVLEDITKDLGRLKKGGLESAMYSDYDDQFQWFIAGALLLLIAEFLLTERKSKLFNWKAF